MCYHPCPREGSKVLGQHLLEHLVGDRCTTTYVHRRALKRFGPAFIAKIHGQQVYCHPCPQGGNKEFWTSIYCKNLWAEGALPPMFTRGK